MVSFSVSFSTVTEHVNDISAENLLIAATAFDVLLITEKRIKLLMVRVNILSSVQFSVHRPEVINTLSGLF
jgi:hypothetical protein